MNPDPGTIRLLVATDNHLGYLERDPIRGDDSFRSFEEILQLAHRHQVDAILLGGDLFHDNKPSRKTLHKMIQLLRHYCFGDRPCALQILSDQSVNFPSNPGHCVNYEDPNINISMPVFSIHGNHDDPAGDGNLCSLELLSAAGLVNYFGRSMDVDDVTISPILINKGNTRLALFGLGNIRDERLHRAFEKGKVKILRPSSEQQEWFNLFVIHQNRVPHGPKNFIPESFLDQFLDLVLWGHEHECLIDPQYNTEQDFYVTQPGSSVATSLSEGESKTKHVGLLEISGKSFELSKIRLKTVRPFIMGEVSLRHHLNFTNQEKQVRTFLENQVENMIIEAIRVWKEDNEIESTENVDIPLPIIRLKVEYGHDGPSDYATFNPQRFGQAFVDRVANPKDILLFYRKRIPGKLHSSKEKKSQDYVKPEIPDRLSSVQVESLVNEYLESQSLIALPENELGEAVRTFVEKDDKDAIKEFFQSSLSSTRDTLKSKKEITRNEQILDEIEMEKNLRVAKYYSEYGIKEDTENNSGSSENISNQNDNDGGLKQSSHMKSDSDGNTDSDSDALSVTDALPKPKMHSRAKLGLSENTFEKEATPNSKAKSASITRKTAPAKSRTTNSTRKRKAAVSESEESEAEVIDIDDLDDEGREVVDLDEEEFVPESDVEAPPLLKRRTKASTTSTTMARGSKAKKAEPKQAKLPFGNVK